MAKRTYTIHLPVFSEYLFRLLTTLPEERLQRLSTEERSKISTVKDIRKMCATETFEKLLFIYTKLGFEWGLTLAPNEKAIKDAMEACRHQYDHDLHRIDAIEAIVREKVCVVSSREVMQMIQMCAQNCLTQNYRLTYLMTKTRSTKKILQAYDKETKDAEDAIVFMNKLMLEQMKGRWYAQDVLKLSPQELLILLTLYERKKSAISIKNLTLKLNSENNKFFIKKNVISLEKRGLIMSDKAKNGIGRWSQNTYYSINTRGIELIMDYHMNILEKAQKDIL
jgi:hypothetical protein